MAPLAASYAALHRNGGGRVRAPAAERSPWAPVPSSAASADVSISRADVVVTRWSAGRDRVDEFVSDGGVTPSQKVLRSYGREREER